MWTAIIASVSSIIVAIITFIIAPIAQDKINKKKVICRTIRNLKIHNIFPFLKEIENNLFHSAAIEDLGKRALVKDLGLCFFEAIGMVLNRFVKDIDEDNITIDKSVEYTYQVDIYIEFVKKWQQAYDNLLRTAGFSRETIGFLLDVFEKATAKLCDQFRGELRNICGKEGLDEYLKAEIILDYWTSFVDRIYRDFMLAAAGLNGKLCGLKYKKYIIGVGKTKAEEKIDELKRQLEQERQLRDATNINIIELKDRIDILETQNLTLLGAVTEFKTDMKAGRLVIPKELEWGKNEKL